MKFLLISILTVVRMTAFNFSFNTIDGTVLQPANYEGRKILLVNIVDPENSTSQLQELELLYQKHKDSIVVIGCIISDSLKVSDLNRIRMLFRDSSHLTFPITEPLIRTGDDQHPLFKWIADRSANGMVSNGFNRGLTKILINRSGKVYGIYSNAITPKSEALALAISNRGE